MTAPLRLAASLVLSLLVWLPMVPGALAGHEDPALIAGRYLAALVLSRIGVGLLFRVVGAYAAEAELESDEGAEPEPEQPFDDGQAYDRRRTDPPPASPVTEEQLLDDALDDVRDTTALVP